MDCVVCELSLKADFKLVGFRVQYRYMEGHTHFNQYCGTEKIWREGQAS